ncbi:MAG: hypothetical protein IPN33_16850 [Saprospiraceae bacterium]|nr:hypothetical protein [Saprospiraceae bacterium]
MKNEAKLHYLLAYIHHNPIHHNFCASYDSWVYSSWGEYQNLHHPSIVNREEVLRWFDAEKDKALERLIQFHRDFRVDKKMENETLEED